MAHWTKDQIDEGKEALRKTLKPGDTIYLIERHRTDSGMARFISLFLFKAGKPVSLTNSTAAALGYSLLRKEGHDTIRVNGFEKEAAFEPVSQISSLLWNGDQQLNPVIL